MLPLIEPPLINSANPWASSQEDLQSLFDCPDTGAVTIRTSLLQGFQHNEAIHQYGFFDLDHSRRVPTSDGSIGSLNTLGYSPIKLSEYLKMLPHIVLKSRLPDDIRDRKAFIISVTGSVDDVAECSRMIRVAQTCLRNPLCMEINLSCPNIPDQPPPAYSAIVLGGYLQRLASSESSAVAIGIKTPPYTHFDQYRALIDALLASGPWRCPIDFITATNTLGSCLVLRDMAGSPLLNSATGTGIGGMAGSPLHSLSLGNVKTIRSLLDQHETLREIDIIGVGGVSDWNGYQRMQAVGAKVVGIGTALGVEGISVFSKILRVS